MTKHNGVRHFHHGGLDVQGEHDTCFESILNFFFIKLAQCSSTHEHAVNDFAVQQGHFWFEHNRFTGYRDQLHAHIARFVQGHGLFTVVKVTAVHVRHVRA